MWRLRRSRSSAFSSVTPTAGATVRAWIRGNQQSAMMLSSSCAASPDGDVVEPQLGADRRQRFLARGEVAHLVELGAAAERLALDQPDEVGTGGEEVEVVGDGAGEDGLGGLAAGQRPGPAGPHGFADLGERALQHRPVELGLGPEEVARRPPGDPGGGPTSFRLVASNPWSANSCSAASRIAARVRSGLRSRSEMGAIRPSVVACLLFSKLCICRAPSRAEPLLNSRTGQAGASAAAPGLGSA